MEDSKIPVVKRSLFSWILPGNIKLQISIVLIIAVTVFTRVFPLEMQKRIVNEAINLKQINLLLFYSGLFLIAVLLSTVLKFFTNILHTLISQRVLARIRKELYQHILTLPINFFRKTGPGMVVASILTELAPAGEFAGIAIATPLTSVLTLMAFAGYLFWLNPLLAIVSMCIYPFVLIIVPILQKRANIANKKRVDETRRISNKITEAITGIHEIHGNGSYHIENNKFNGMVDKLLTHRMFWSIYKQSVKIVNNFFNNLSPFLIFLLGGYLTIKGQLELGALVAFLSAQEKLYDPWKEVIDFYQLYQDASVRYDKIMNYFDVKAEHILKPVGREPYDLEGSIEIKDLSFETEDGISLIEGVNLFLKPGEHLALIGFSGSGKSTLAQCVGQLYKYTDGNLLIGEKEVSELTKSDVVHNVGYVAQTPFIFDGTIEENLLYSCEALTDGNGSGPNMNLPTRDEIIEVLQQTGVFADVLRFGLNTHLVFDKHKKLVSQILNVRKNFQRDFGDALEEYVEFFNENTYLYHSNVAENLIFGAPNIDDFNEKNLLHNEYFMKLLDKADLTRPLLTLGDELSKQTVDILGSLEPDKILFEQSPINPDELDDFKIFVERTKDKKLHQLGEEDSRKLLDIALRFIPGKHKMVKLPNMLETLILEGRAMFREKILKDNPGAVSFLNMSEYILSQTILNNILFGKAITERAEAQETIVQNIIQLLIEEDLLETIVEIGMQFEVGSRGDRLSGGQRQKVAIARAFLKSPKILIMDEATSGLDNKSQARIQNQLETRWKGRSTVIAVVHRLDITKNFDKIAVLKAGKIVEMGTYNELFAMKGVLHDLVVGKK